MFVRAELHAIRSIRLQLRCSSRICVSNKPPWPLQSCSGFSSFTGIGNRIFTKLKQKKEGERIPLVPKLDDEGKEVEQSVPADNRLERGLIKREELEEEERLQREQDERIEEFEKETKGKESLTKMEFISERARERSGPRLSQKVFGRPTDNITYLRDTIRFKVRKERVEYNVDMYKPNADII
jgi:hypothetical protein